MKSIIVASAFVAVVLADSNPLIPTGISSGCSSFLTTLNTDSTLASCLTSVVTATAAFGPTSNATSPDVKSALDTLCASTACSSTAIAAQLNSFATACNTELVTTPNADVLSQYDALYTLDPFKASLCSQSDGAYCASSLASSSTTARVAVAGKSPAESLYIPVVSSQKRDTSQIVLKPNVTTYRAENIVFLGLQADAASGTLCSDCAKAVMTAWIDAMNDVPYAPGIAKSPILAGQPSLYNGMLSTCGQDFLSGSSINNAAGSLGGGVAGSAASGASPRAEAGMAASVIGALALAAFAL